MVTDSPLTVYSQLNQNNSVDTMNGLSRRNSHLQSTARISGLQNHGFFKSFSTRHEGLRKSLKSENHHRNIDDIRHKRAGHKPLGA